MLRGMENKIKVLFFYDYTYFSPKYKQAYTYTDFHHSYGFLLLMKKKHVKIFSVNNCYICAVMMQLHPLLTEWLM